MFFLDIIAGILIIFMVIHHVFPSSFVDLLLSRLFFFYMPWFFFKAGMFFNPQKTILSTFENSVKRLLIPYILFLFVGQMVLAFQLYSKNELHINFLTSTIIEVLSTGSALGNGPLWFLMSLFFVRMVFSILGRQFSSILILTLLSIFLSWAIYASSFELPLYIGNVCLGSFFWGLGYLFKNIQYRTIFIIFCTFGYIVTISVFPILGSFVQNTSDNYFWWIIASFMAIITYNGLFRMANINIKLLSFCGKHSLEILVTHIPFLKLFRFLF